MTTETTKRSTRPKGKLIPKAYLELLRRFLLRPLENDQDLDDATALAEELCDRKQLLPEEEQYLGALGDLIQSYEAEHYPIRDVGAAEMLRYLIDQRGAAQQTVAKETGIANSTLSALLKGREAGGRDMTRKHIERFAAYFGVEPGVFLPGN